MVAVFLTQHQAEIHHREGLCRLIGCELRGVISKKIANNLSWQKYARILQDFLTIDGLINDVINAAILHLLPEQVWEIRDELSYRKATRLIKDKLVDTVMIYDKLLQKITDNYQQVLKELHCDDYYQQELSNQAKLLFTDKFLYNTPWKWMVRYPVYIKAMQRRLQKPVTEKEINFVRQWWLLYNRYNNFITDDPRYKQDNSQQQELLQEYFWMLHEYNISEFAQELKTIAPVSRQRLDKLWLKIINKK